MIRLEEQQCIVGILIIVRRKRIDKNEPKMVIIIRKDLNMRKGKYCSQVAHASMKILLDLMEKEVVTSSSTLLTLEASGSLREWLEGLFTKICVYVKSEKELLDIYATAKDKGILCSLITDSGATEFKGVPTNTCVAVGPDYPEVLDEITGHLPLL